MPPIKDFICEDCNVVTEFIIAMTESKPKIKCPSCGGDKMQFKAGIIAHYGIEGNNSGSTPGRAHRKFDGKDN